MRKVINNLCFFKLFKGSSKNLLGSTRVDDKQSSFFQLNLQVEYEVMKFIMNLTKKVCTKKRYKYYY